MNCFMTEETPTPYEQALEQLQPKKELLFAEAERDRRRAKDGQPNEIPKYVNEFGVAEPWITIKDWNIDRYFGGARDINWLIEGILPRSVPGCIAGMGAVGKSYLLLDLAIRIAAGPGISPQYALGGRIPKRGKVVFITAEDSFDAIHRRINQIVMPGEMAGDLQKAKLLDHLYVVPLADTNTGLRPLLINRGGEYMMTDEWFELVDQIMEIGGVDLVALDPLQAVVQADVNADPAASSVFWSAVGKLCAESGATSLVTHHMRKEGMREIDGPMAARMAIRGSTGIVDGARWVLALWAAQANDRASVEKVIGEPLGELDMVQAAVCKSNDIPMTPVRTFIRDKQSGLLLDRTEQITEELEAHRYLSEEQIQETFGLVSVRWSTGDPVSHHKAAKTRWLGTWMIKHFDITEDAAKEYIGLWLAEGRLVKEPHPRIKGSYGLRYEP